MHQKKQVDGNITIMGLGGKGSNQNCRAVSRSIKMSNNIFSNFKKSFKQCFHIYLSANGNEQLGIADWLHDNHSQ